jgi:general secretion pathway protein A
MYEDYYGLRERPFDLTPNPRYLLLTPNHQEALTNLHYGIAQRKGVTAVLGPAGTGKTTLVRMAVARIVDEGGRCLTFNNPTLSRSEFVQLLARGFDLSPKAAGSKTLMLSELEAQLRRFHQAGVNTALVIDEAQALSDELLEEVRLLVNLETDTEKLLPVVLTGQAELADRLAQPGCAALKQRIALRCRLLPLTASETAQYVELRLRTAGGDPGRTFTRRAIDLIHQRSGGIPRTISVICDNALMSGFALDQRPIGRDLVLEVCRDLDFGEAQPVAAAEVEDAGQPIVAPAPERASAARTASASTESASTASTSIPSTSIPSTSTASASAVSASIGLANVAPASATSAGGVSASVASASGLPVSGASEPEPAECKGDGAGGVAVAVADERLFATFGSPRRSWFRR